MEPFTERRRSPRIPVAGGAQFVRTATVPVQLIDISLAGVLMLSPDSVSPGESGRLWTRLEGNPIEVEVEVQRVVPPAQGSGGFRIGARFVSVDEATRREMKQFLRHPRP
jgi:c-di-GMP-binding flagellar brake protein YcgR